MLKKITGLIFGNFVIKLFSVVFAVMLWMHVSARGTSEVNLMVPLELRDIPKDMMVVGDVPGYLDVRLQGQEGVVRRLSPKDIASFISLSGSPQGEQSHTLSTSNVTVPLNVRVTSILPNEIKLKLEKIVTKTLPVKADIVGSPVPGLRVAGVSISPSSVTVAGPESSMRGIKGIFTQNIDIEGAAGSLETLAKLDPPSAPGIKTEDENIRVVVTLARKR